MRDAELEGILDFLRGAEQLKNTLRSGWTSNGRQESTAEHTWRLCLMVMLLEKHYADIDILKLMKICIIHDLGEAVNGDIPAIEQIEGVDKGVDERKDLQLLIRPLSQDLQQEILALWDDYENASSKEALLAKALDKIETVLQHTQGDNPSDFNYGFNLGYGKKYTGYDDLTTKLRAVIDKDTRALAESNNTL